MRKNISTETDSDIENRCVVTEGEGVGREGLGAWG